MDESSSNFSFLGSSLRKKLPDSSSNSTGSPYAASPYSTESSAPTRDDLGFSTSSLVSKFVTTPAAQVLPSSGRFNPNKEEAATSTDTNFAAPRNDNPVNERRPNYLGPTVSRASSSSTISSVGDVGGNGNASGRGMNGTRGKKKPNKSQDFSVRNPDQNRQFNEKPDKPGSKPRGGGFRGGAREKNYVVEQESVRYFASKSGLEPGDSLTEIIGMRTLFDGKINRIT